MYSILKITMFCVVVTIIPSCKKMVEVPQPADQLIDGAVFSNSQSAESAMVGLYSEMMRVNNTLSSGGVSVLMALTADETNYNSTGSAILEFYQNSISTLNSSNLSLWRTGYSYIYHTNAILKGLEGSTSLPDSIKRQLTGEAKFMRAWLTFYLVNLYGAVPLATTTNYVVNAQLARNPVTEIYAQIIEDLNEAKKLLPVSLIGGKRIRPNSAVASALLARVYQCNKDWAQAQAEATIVINNANYGLLPVLTDVFLADSREAIFQLQPVNPSINTYEGNTFIPTSATVIPTYTLTNDFVNSFEAGDKRKVNWLKNNIVATVNYYYPFKYKIRTGTTPTENSTLIRLAEQYLIRAEARMELNQIAGANGALADLNIIRRRAGLSDLSGLTEAQTRTAIEKENRLELFTEWGSRWFFLKRTGRVINVLSPIKAPNWQSTDTLLPVPQAEIDRNVRLIQNPGY